MIQLAMHETDLELLEEMITHAGDNLKSLSFQRPILLVFLRHFGCVFCKEAMDDISRRRVEMEACGIRIVFVHMGEPDTAEAYFERFNLQGIDAVSDPNQRFYAAFGLQRGNFRQLYGLQTWIRGFQVKREKGFELEMAQKLGDSTQMPAVFVIQEGEIKEKFIHRIAAERPDYYKLVQCCVI